MKDKYGLFELHGIDGTIGPADMVFNHLKHSRAAKSFEHLCCIVLIAGLSKGERITEKSPYACGQCHQVFVTTAYPLKRLFLIGHSWIISEQGYSATIWAWDAMQTNWYFYAPGLDTPGGSALSNYIQNKGYINFSSNVLGPGVGFWVNKP